MDPESAEPRVFSITCGRKPKVTIPKKRGNRKETVVDIPLSDLIAALYSGTKVTVSREWAIANGFQVSAESSQEKVQESKKTVDVKKEIPTVSTYDFDNDDLP